MSTRQHATRVTSGELRYRIIRQPVGDETRPVSQKLRAAIFDVIGQDLTGLSVLDLYSGSGALAIEALSRGAVRATCVEKSRAALAVIQQNQIDLGISLDIQANSVEKYLESTEQSFDLIFFDPPYVQFDAVVGDQAAAHLNPGGVLIISCATAQILPLQLGAASMVKARTYDDTQLAYYKQ